MATVSYTRRTPEQGVLYRAFVREWPSVRAMSRAANDGGGLPDFIELAVDHFLRCGILGHGFVHAKCDSCEQSIVVAFSCKQRGICIPTFAVTFSHDSFATLTVGAPPVTGSG